ncbi:unnamed protein product, partial [Lampetra planeri]
MSRLICFTAGFQVLLPLAGRARDGVRCHLQIAPLCCRGDEQVCGPGRAPWRPRLPGREGALGGRYGEARDAAGAPRLLRAGHVRRAEAQAAAVRAGPQRRGDHAQHPRPQRVREV